MHDYFASRVSPILPVPSCSFAVHHYRSLDQVSEPVTSHSLPSKSFPHGKAAIPSDLNSLPLAVSVIKVFAVWAACFALIRARRFEPKVISSRLVAQLAIAYGLNTWCWELIHAMVRPHA